MFYSKFVKIDHLEDEFFIKALLELKTHIYLVGGYVRDTLLNLKPKDLDILVTDISVIDLCKTLEKFGSTELVGKSFGVIKFKPYDYVNKDLKRFGTIDIAVPRIEISTGDGHRDFIVQTDNVGIKEDLQRRDFTINGMAFTLKGGLYDPFGGRLDLESKELKLVNEFAFKEDPLRILRGVRFAARFGLAIPNKTMKALKENIDGIKNLPKERITEELFISHQQCDVAKYLIILSRTSIDFRILMTDLQIKDDFPKVMTFSEMILLMYPHSNNYEYVLKLSNMHLLELKSLKLLQEASKSVYKVIAKSLIMKSYKFSNIANVTTLFDNLKHLINEFKSGLLPRSRADLPINGLDIISIMLNSKINKINGFGGKDAHKLGVVFDSILQAILAGNIKNTREDVTWFVENTKFDI